MIRRPRRRQAAMTTKPFEQQPLAFRDATLTAGSPERICASLSRPSVAWWRRIIGARRRIDWRSLQAVQLLLVQLAGDVAARPARRWRITRLRCIAGGRRVSWRRRIVRIVARRIGVIRVLGI